MTSIFVESGRLVSVLDKVKRSLRRKNAAMTNTARRLQLLILSTFETQRDPWGRPWTPHKPSTIDIRLRRGNSTNEILLDSYNLYRDIDARSTESSAEVFYEGSDEYAWVQQLGNPLNSVFGRGNGPIPARPFFPLTASMRLNLPDAWLRELTKPLEQHIQSAFE